MRKLKHGEIKTVPNQSHRTCEQRHLCALSAYTVPLTQHRCSCLLSARAAPQRAPPGAVLRDDQVGVSTAEASPRPRCEGGLVERVRA